MDKRSLPQVLRTVSPYTLSVGSIFIILVILLIYTLFRITSLTSSVTSLEKKLASTTQALARTNEEMLQNVANLHRETTGLSNTLSTTQKNIYDVTTQISGVTETVGSISGTVGNLQKLSKLDPELLKKYSKVYFMNENYKPIHLSVIPAEYTYSSFRTEYFLTEAMPQLQNMIESAKKDGISLYIKSGYRSFSEQKSLKSSYTILYGAGTANSFSADQGYSEHQLGTTVDFITTGLYGKLAGFDKTEAYTWLSQHAHRFGFILSYPRGNAYYIYEPWHWRYVGTSLATYLYTNGLTFYDIDQRTIDTYLITIFD
ncbi:MAG: hypothetical protein RLZZ308_319 [Candidatus Parcubacteria bacterium]|jgi:LAS superfamily LD-carboxypeptidase LdcB